MKMKSLRRKAASYVDKMKSDGIGHTSRRNCPFKTRYWRKYKGRGDEEKRRKQLLCGLEEKRSYRKLKGEAVENSLWKRLWTRRKTECGLLSPLFDLIAVAGENIVFGLSLSALHK